MDVREKIDVRIEAEHIVKLNPKWKNKLIRFITYPT